LNVIKVRTNVMLILFNVTLLEPSNAKKKKGTTECDKSKVMLVKGIRMKER